MRREFFGPYPRRNRIPLTRSLITFECQVCHQQFEEHLKHVCEKCGVVTCRDCWDKDVNYEEYRLTQNALLLNSGRYCPTCYHEECRREEREWEEELENDRRFKEELLEQERREEQARYAGAAAVSAEIERHERDRAEAEEKGTWFQCPFCNGHEAPNWVARCARCGERGCDGCIPEEGSDFYQSFKVFSHPIPGRLCPVCMRIEDEALEEEQRERSRAAAREQEEERDE